MPVVRDPDDLPARHGTGWTQYGWASPQLLGVPVPVGARRIRADRIICHPGDTAVWTVARDWCTWAPAS